MAEALTPIFAAAALVLCAAAVAKLRSPIGAVRALDSIGLPGGAGTVRALAVGELALGGAGIVHPAPVTAVAISCVYTTFLIVTLALASRRASCGCFGEAEVPASIFQSVLNGVLALVALAAVFKAPHGLGWMLARPTAPALVLAIGIAGCAFAAVLAYTELPRAWGAWRPR